MVNRLEFTKKVKLEIFRRAGGPDDVRCEKCGWKIRGRNFQIDHKVAEWILEDIAHGLRPPLTAEDGWLLGNEKECGCHTAKTAVEAGQRAHGDRIIAKAAKADKPKRGGFSKRLSRKMNGSIVNRETGEIIKRGRNG
jgi:hypothetical protein